MRAIYSCIIIFKKLYTKRIFSKYFKILYD